MASVHALGLFTGYDPFGQYGSGTWPLQQPKSLNTLGPSSYYRATASDAVMPFNEYVDFMWRVKSWQFEWDIKTVDSLPFPAFTKSTTRKQTFAEKETDMLLPFNMDLFNLDVIGFLQYVELPTDPPIYPLSWFEFRSYWDSKYYWDLNISTENMENEFKKLHYFPSWFTQSFAAPHKIEKTSYLTFKISFGLIAGYSQTWSCKMSPDEWWEYDPLDGKGPIYDKSTGQQIRFDLGMGGK